MKQINNSTQIHLYDVAYLLLKEEMGGGEKRGKHKHRAVISIVF